MKKVHLFLGLLLVAFAACKNDKTTTETTGETTETGTTASATKSYTLTPFTPSQEYADAELVSYTYNNNMFDFKVDKYQLGQQTPDAESKMCANSAKGQHIHLIFGQDPYLAKYAPKFELAKADGEYHMLAFLSRSYHESIKSAKAFKAEKITVKAGAATGQTITEPTLFYSRPKGTYTGEDTKKVMLDFYLVNTEISASGNKVKAEINGETYMIDKWQPYYIEGLKNGVNRVKLTLVDKNGKAIDSPINGVEREFTVMTEPPTK